MPEARSSGCQTDRVRVVAAARPRSVVTAVTTLLNSASTHLETQWGVEPQTVALRATSRTGETCALDLGQFRTRLFLRSRPGRTRTGIFPLRRR